MRPPSSGKESLRMLCRNRAGCRERRRGLPRQRPGARIVTNKTVPVNQARAMAGSSDEVQMAVGTRAFRAEDIDEVARLWLKAFRRRSDAPPEPLLAYFRELFFDAPWRDPALPSLVCEDASGIVAFLGVLPRTMMFRGERL